MSTQKAPNKLVTAKSAPASSHRASQRLATPWPSWLFAGFAALVAAAVEATAQTPANAALSDVRNSAKPVAISREDADNPKSKQQREEDQRRQADGFAAAAVKAKDFLARFPTDPQLSEVKRIEAISLIRAARAGHAPSAGEAPRVAAAFVADTQNDHADRYTVALALKGWDIQKKNLRTADRVLAEYEQSARELLAEFADVPDVYEPLLGVASLSPEPKARALAAEIIAKPAPISVKTAARQIIDRFDLPGKKLNLKFLVSNGTEVDLSAPRTGPTVLYLWENSGITTSAAMQHIRDAAKDSGVFFVGVNLDSDSQPVRTGHRGQNVPGPQRWEPRGLDGAVPKALLARKVPAVYVFDKTGVLKGVGEPRQLPTLLTDAGK